MILIQKNTSVSASGFLPENMLLFYLKTPDRQWEMMLREKSKPVYTYLRKIDSQTGEADGSERRPDRNEN